MDVIKTISYNKRQDGTLYLIKLKYGIKEDKSDHQLVLSIYEITDENLGKKHIVVNDDITDVIGVGVYNANTLRNNIEEEIMGIVDGYIKHIEHKKKNIEIIKEKLENIEIKNRV